MLALYRRALAALLRLVAGDDSGRLAARRAAARQAQLMAAGWRGTGARRVALPSVGDSRRGRAAAAQPIAGASSGSFASARPLAPQRPAGQDLIQHRRGRARRRAA